jgi:ABC-type methionine transport system permease subunit
MNDTKIFSELLGGVATQLPVLLVCLVGIMVALISWRRAPAASLWTLLAFGLALLLCILIPISQQTMLRMMKESSLDTRVTANIALGVVWSIVRAISYILLLVGVYAGRKSASPA